MSTIYNNTSNIVGIDFDNTIITYDQVFIDISRKMFELDLPDTANKQLVRDTLRQENNGEWKWQLLQTEVYGREIKNAAPSCGVITALQELKAAGRTLCIISHKTEYANTDKSINLRTAAREWLHENSILNNIIPENKIFFAATREEKIHLLKSCGCHCFIDDLIEVFRTPGFPKSVYRILYAEENNNSRNEVDFTSKNWAEITEVINNACR